MDVKIYKYIENNKDKFILSNNTSFMNAYLLGNIEGKELFIKRINTAKIKEVYDEDYCKTWKQYYNLVRDFFECAKTYGIYNIDGEIYEVYEKIDKMLFLENKNIFEWDKYKKLVEKVLQNIQSLTSTKFSDGRIIGIESTMWNFTIDGKMFDFSPPRYMGNINSSIFTRKGDSDHYKRTFYRNYTSLGMKLSVINTSVCIIRNKEIIINNLPNNWEVQLLQIFFMYCNYEEYTEIFNYLNKKEETEDEFSKHPLMILKKIVNDNKIL